MKSLWRWWNRNKKPYAADFVFVWSESDDYEFLDFAFKERRAKGKD